MGYIIDNVRIVLEKAIYDFCAESLFGDLRCESPEASVASFIDEHRDDLNVIEFDQQGNMRKQKPIVLADATSLGERS